MYISEEKYEKKFEYYSQFVLLDGIQKNRRKFHEMQNNSDVKLNISLVPNNSWFSNVRIAVKKSHWDRIRYVTYGLANYKCEICQERGTMHPVECHEIWDFDNENKVQSLSGFVAVCPLCHEVIHMGRTLIKSNSNRAFARLRKINNFSEEQAEEHFEHAFLTYAERSKVKWIVNFDYLKNYDVGLLSKEEIEKRQKAEKAKYL